MLGNKEAGALDFVYALRVKGRSNVSRKAEYKDIYRKTIEIPQRTRIIKDNCSLKVHNAPLKLASQFRDNLSMIISYDHLNRDFSIAVTPVPVMSRSSLTSKFSSLPDRQRQQFTIESPKL